MTRVISDLIWFVKLGVNDFKNKGLYPTKVLDYKKVMVKIFNHYMFHISQKFSQKIKQDVHNIDMKKYKNKIKV